MLVTKFNGKEKEFEYWFKKHKAYLLQKDCVEITTWTGDIPPATEVIAGSTVNDKLKRKSAAAEHQGCRNPNGID